MVAWLFVLIVFVGLIVVGIWYDKIVPPITAALTGEKAPKTALQATSANVDVQLEHTIHGGSKSIPANEELAKVQSRLNEFISGKRSVIRNLFFLAITVFLFIRLGLFSGSLSTILMIAAVLLVHELGHAVGMKIFGYRNVHMFFIPMFGAATSGIQTNPSGFQKAIVSLLGPLPGIVIGFGLTGIYVLTQDERLIQPAWTFLLLNAFNLLPFFPLDGGRFVESLFSSKSFALEKAFKIVSVFGFAAAWLVFVGPTRFIFGLSAILTMLIISAANSFTFASAVKKVADRFPATGDLHPNDIPLEYLSTIYEVLKSKSLFGANPKALATQIYYVWQRLLNKPPSKKAVIGFVGFYVFSLAISLSSPMILKSAVRHVHIEKSIKEFSTLNGPDTKKSDPLKFDLKGLK